MNKIILGKHFKNVICEGNVSITNKPIDTGKLQFYEGYYTIDIVDVDGQIRLIIRQT